VSTGGCERAPRNDLDFPRGRSVSAKPRAAETAATVQGRTIIVRKRINTELSGFGLSAENEDEVAPPVAPWPRDQRYCQHVEALRKSGPYGRQLRHEPHIKLETESL
jgi:hypothetical protein